MLDKDDKQFSHPSYGMVGFTRGQVGGSGMYVFGSAVKTNHIISLAIRQCRRDHHLNQDWYFGGKELVEVHMSELQFAKLITSLNVGQGVPCTINYVNGLDYKPGESVKPPEVPDPSEIQMVQDEFRIKAKLLNEKFNGTINDLRAVAANSNMSKKDKEAIDKAIDRFSTEIKSNMPFLLSQLTEAAGRVINAAKTEVLAWTERTLKSVGLSHMKNEAPTMIGADETKKMEDL